MKATYSLRLLLVGVSMCALICWWLSAPRNTALRFIELVNAGDLEAAAKMFATTGTAAMLTGPNPPEHVVCWRPDVAWHDRLRGLVRGRCRVELAVQYRHVAEPNEGLFPLEASRRGIHVLPASIDHTFTLPTTLATAAGSH